MEELQQPPSIIDFKTSKLFFFFLSSLIPQCIVIVYKTLEGRNQLYFLLSPAAPDGGIKMSLAAYDSKPIQNIVSPRR